MHLDQPIVMLDRSGDGKIIETVGDLAAADRIAVIVPGVANTLGNFWTGLGRVARRSPSWQAEQVYEQARALDPQAHVAVVAWLGYDPPEGVGGAALREDRAADGAEALARFVAQLCRYLSRYRPDAPVRADRPPAITVIGHSYGSTVVGLAAHRLGPQVTDIVAVGSPGMGVRRAADLRTPARVWAGAARTDWIHRVPGVRVFGIGHGPLPSSRAFGARALPVDDVAGHDGYFVPGTGSLRAIASIMLSGCATYATGQSTCTTASRARPPLRS